MESTHPDQIHAVISAVWVMNTDRVASWYFIFNVRFTLPTWPPTPAAVTLSELGASTRSLSIIQAGRVLHELGTSDGARREGGSSFNSFFFFFGFGLI